MISICIPVYNFDVTNLASKLYEQISNAGMTCDLIFIDDYSTPDFRERNRSFCNERGRYIELRSNVGRATIRNLFLKEAKSDYLLFLDCDSVITSERFIEDYIEEINRCNPDVICGGRIYPKEPPEKNRILRWKYGTIAESQRAELRRLKPNRSFMTNNFVIRKELLARIRFDERLTTYGHEDTLFGYELAKANITIHHIENPVLNGDVETNREFLRKTDEGLANLAMLVNKMKDTPDFCKSVRLSLYHSKLKRKGILWLLWLSFLLSSPIIRKLLASGNAGLRVFNFYKLGLYHRELRRTVK